MLSPPQMKQFVRQTFDEVALLIGSWLVCSTENDRAIWRLLERLERLRTRTLAQLFPDAKDAEESIPQEHRIHPAVEVFLQRNQSSFAK